MTYATEALKAGRRVARAVEIDLPACGLTYGVAPCTAAGAAGTECFNTNQTCQDLPNFDSDGVGGRLGTVKTYTFTEDLDGFPGGGFPFLVNVKATPTKIDPKKGLGSRETITVQLQDYPHHDIGIDPYVSTRPYDPITRGTMLGKLLARNRQSYLGRPLRLLDGYLAQPFDWANFKARNYFITKIDGPNRNGRVTIEAKDIISFIDDVQLPAPSDTELVGNITAAAGSLIIDNASDFDAPGVLRIGDEIIAFASATPDALGQLLGGLTRGYGGTTAESHKDGDAVQEGIEYSGTNAVDVVHDLLNRAGIADPQINTTEFDFEKSVWLSGSNVRNILTEPEKATELVADVCRQYLLYSWWDSFTSQVRLRSISPAFGAQTLPQITDDMLIGAVNVADDLKAQITRAIVAFQRRNFTESGELRNYDRVNIAVDLLAESADRFDRKKLKKILSDWIDLSGDAFTLATRLVSRYARGERVVRFTIDQRHGEFWAGDKLTLITNQIQDETGAAAPVDVQILEADQDGHQVRFLAVTDDFQGRYAKYAPDTVPNYPLQSDFEKAEYASYSDDNGNLNSGTELGHRYI